ncbi:hypothetical protein [Bradyrhizobium sp.]|uniref:hypothetical protein n=1 Tax=Bradyrhizobium sp. TaxID=376 RepID=UPI00262C6C8F|nr:hypothetical protein [Bradyrhizobium sp.]
MSYLDLDPLICRGQLAMIENRFLRSELRQLRRERWHARQLLRVLVFENASVCSESRSVREEMICRRSERSRT